MSGLPGFGDDDAYYNAALQKYREMKRLLDEARKKARKKARKRKRRLKREQRRNAKKATRKPDDVVPVITPDNSSDKDSGSEDNDEGSKELKQLKRKGYLVVPCILADHVKVMREQFRATLAAMPEFKHGQAMLNYGYNEPHSSFKGKPVPFVGGGFGALGNPSSFHNAFARNVRKQAHNCVLKAVFKEMLQRDPDLKFEQVIDRMMFRRAGQSASAESWHRDESLHAKDGDHIFGGWINLDDFDQTFSGIPESHSEVGLRNGGFATIPKAKHTQLDAKKESIAIPPGHILIFYERMVHEVVSKKLKKDQHRIFLGWRTTKQTTPLTPNLNALLDRQAVIPIKSGQIPPMYPKLYWTNHRDRILKPWSDEFIDDAIKEKRVLKKTGEKYNIVQQKVKKGLVELKTELGVNSRDYPPYTPAEISMYHPSREGLGSQNDESSDRSSSDKDNSSGKNSSSDDGETPPNEGRRRSARNRGKRISYKEDSSSEEEDDASQEEEEEEEGSEYSAPGSESSEDDIDSDEEDDAKKDVDDLLNTSEDENVDDELNDVAENNEERKNNQAENRSIRKQMMAKYRPIIHGHMQWLLENAPDEFKPTMRVIVANSMSTAKSCRYEPLFDFWQPLIEKVFRGSGVEFANLVHNTSFDKSRLRDERQVFYTVVRGHALVVVTEPGKNPLLFDSNGVITRDGDRLRTFGTQSLPLEVVFTYDSQRYEHKELWERLLIGVKGRCASWSLFTSLLLKSTTTDKAKAFLENITNDRARVVSQLMVNLFMRIISVEEEPFRMTPMEKYFGLWSVLKNWKQEINQIKEWHRRWKEEVYPSRTWSFESRVTMGVLKNPRKAVQTKLLLERFKKGENIVLSGAQPGGKSVMIYICMPYGMNPAEQGRNFKITCTIPKSFEFTTWGQVVEHMCKFPKLDNFFGVKDLFQLSEYDIYKHPSGGQWYKTEGRNLDQPRNRQRLSTPWIIQPHTPFVYKHYTLRHGELPPKPPAEKVGNRRIKLSSQKLPLELPNIPVTLFGARIDKFTTLSDPRRSTRPVKEYLKKTNPPVSLLDYAFKSWGWPLAGVKIHYNATEKLLQHEKFRGRPCSYVDKPTSFGPADAYAGVMERKKEKAKTYRQKFLDFVKNTVEPFVVPHLHEDWEPVTYLFDDGNVSWEKMGLRKARRTEKVGVHVNTPIINLYVNVDVCPVYGFRRVTGSVASNRQLGYKSSVSLDWISYESPEMTAVRKKMDEKLKELKGIMNVLHKCKYHKDRKDPERGKGVLETETRATKRKDACLMSIQSLREEYEVKCSESKDGLGLYQRAFWYDDWKDVEREYNNQLRRAHQYALDEMGLPKWRSTACYYDTIAKFHLGNARYTEWWKSKWLRRMAVHGMPEIIDKYLFWTSRKLTFYIVGIGFHEDFDVDNLKQYLLADAGFEVVVEDGRAVSIQDPLGDFLSRLDIRMVPGSARMGDLLEEHRRDPNRYVILTGGKGYNTFRREERVIDIKP